ncbi:diguanylate cyclase domain-containing protein [Paracoccus sp. NGMCC 1.201697]|uniref:diguanylate cyclase n=1 Tax=Paracoccus broussonetiae subsp. drimophilus TaxID=3373869 RepID=A0ABW7LKQ8_9RHOB
MNVAGRILVADGAPKTRIKMKARLSSACYDVTAAGSGAEALRMAALVRPQLVLIGTSLPDMTGAQLCAQFRTQLDGAEIPVLVQVQGPQRIAALQAGASALIDGMDDDLTLFARIRGLMRGDGQSDRGGIGTHPDFGMAEPVAEFRHDTRPRAVFVAGQPAIALGWQFSLRDRLNFSISISDPDRALSQAARGHVPDLYLIAGDIQQPGDGLRLLSELRSRPMSRDAGFVVALRPDRADLTAMALDLGAGDVLTSDLTQPTAAIEAAIRIEGQLGRKLACDRKREETRRNMRWAMTDPLTGLHNRRHALPRLAELFANSLRHGGGLAVMLLDLDRFKLVNDLHGHAAGDAVLQAVAHRMTASLPPDALIARMGGEEFLVALPDCDAQTAHLLAEDVRRAIAAPAIPLPPESGTGALSITISAGIAAFDRGPASASDLDSTLLLARADRALLSAKSSGRNRIVVAPAALAA